jgi:hypothetical protein
VQPGSVHLWPAPDGIGEVVHRDGDEHLVVKPREFLGGATV